MQIIHGGQHLLKHKISDIRGLTNPLLFKGGIAVAADFPTSEEVKDGWLYKITADVTDNDASKTNTSIELLSGDEVVWDGSSWLQLGGETVPVTSWEGTTTDATLTEIFVGGIASSRFVIDTLTATNFKVLVTGYDSTANETAGYIFEGIIKRDSSNNTVLVYANKTVMNEEDTTWDCVVEADDANEALVVKVTGDATNSVSWKAKLVSHAKA